MHIELGTTEFWDKLAADPAHLAAEVCRVDVVNLDATLEFHAALRAWVNAAYETAKITEERIKWDETRLRATLLLKAADFPDPRTKKSKTVAVMNAEVDTNPEVEKVMLRLLDQQAVRGTLRAMASALEDRKDMLIQIAAKQRKESGDYR